MIELGGALRDDRADAAAMSRIIGEISADHRRPAGGLDFRQQ